MPPTLSGSLTVPLNATRVLPGGSRPAMGRGACAAQGQHAADFPVAGDRLALVAALQRQTKDIVARFRRAMAILCAGHFAERQRFAEGSTRMVISLRVILSSMAIVPRSKRILSRRKDQLEGALSPEVRLSPAS